jgi:hypothetical protein
MAYYMQLDDFFRGTFHKMYITDKALNLTACALLALFSALIGFWKLS